MPDAVAEQFAHKQNSDLLARVPRAEDPAYKRARDTCPLCLPGKHRALPDWRSGHHN
jgi:hypothetical protein